MAQTAKKSVFVKPIVVLTVICLAMSAVLSFTNSVTKPIILAAEKATQEAARKEVLPDADGFETMEVKGVPDSITEVDRATNDAGYVVQITSDGYGGKDTLKMICGIDKDGKITKSQVLSHSETAGLGSKVTEEDFQNQFKGKDGDSLDKIVKISGATFSSNYYINAIKDAFAAYDLAKEGA